MQPASTSPGPSRVVQQIATPRLESPSHSWVAANRRHRVIIVKLGVCLAFPTHCCKVLRTAASHTPRCVQCVVEQREDAASRHRWRVNPEGVSGIALVSGARSMPSFMCFAYFLYITFARSLASTLLKSYSFGRINRTRHDALLCCYSP